MKSKKTANGMVSTAYNYLFKDWIIGLGSDMWKYANWIRYITSYNDTQHLMNGDHREL